MKELEIEELKKDVVYEDEKTCANHLRKVMDEHRVWNNPLLKSCTDGNLIISDFRFIFLQYYFYSQNSIKYLAIGMLKFDDEHYHYK